MASNSIAGGNGRIIAVAGSVGHLEDELASLGYDGITFVPVGRQVRAYSLNAKGQRAEAIGYNEVAAAQSLVRVLKRR
jgi:hypothetical protein